MEHYSRTRIIAAPCDGPGTAAPTRAVVIWMLALPMPLNSPLRVAILMPVYNDWAAASEIVSRIDKTIGSGALDILMVDDGSTQRWEDQDFQGHYGAIQRINILRLRRNVGHQRAIALGLVQIYRTLQCDAVLIMDADGEDTAEGAAELLRGFVKDDGRMAIFAERSRRSESAIFQIFYWLYKVLHRLLTGIGVRVGNFSVVPFGYLETLVVLSELWNHYAAAVFRSRMPFRMIPIPRGTRIAGKSSMNFVSLVTHGLSAISVFSDIVGVRLLIGACGCGVVALLAIAMIACVRFFTDAAIPGWATVATGMIAIILIQIISIATGFTFFMLSTRTGVGFIPLRDASLFVAELVEIRSHG